MLSNTSLDFILDMRETDCKQYDRWCKKWNKESSASGMLFKKQVLLEVSYFARNIYDTETVTLVLCLLTNSWLIFLENNIVGSIFKFSGCRVNWYFSRTIWYTFIFEVLFKQLFCSSFRKRVHNSKEIVNLQGLLVLTVGYVEYQEISTNKVLLYYWKNILYL